MHSFGDFIDKHGRESKEHLRILGHILDKAEFKIKPHLDNEREPYLYLVKPEDIDPKIEEIPFGGIRIYCRGKDIVCFRSQMNPDVEPFGETYHLDIGGMYKDFIKDKDKKTPYLIIYEIIQTLKDFFIKCGKEAAATQEKKDSQMGAVVVGGTGTDYSNTVTSMRRS